MLRNCYTDIEVNAMWSVTEAAQKLGISGQRVRRLLSEGRIKGTKVGSTWVVLELSYTRAKET